MCLSDPTLDADWEWKQLSLKPESAPGGRQDGDDTFQPLYTPSGAIESKDEFTPIYESPRQRSRVEEPDEKDVDSEPLESEPTDDEIRNAAYEEGLAEGKKDGFEAGKKETESALEALLKLRSEMQKTWDQMVTSYEEQIIDLICRATEKVVFGEIDIDQDVVKRAILHAFEMVPEPMEVTIEVSAEDAAFIETLKEDFFAQVKTLNHISVASNPSLTKGGCRVKTQFGEVDATLESRLDAIRQTIKNVPRSKANAGPSASSGV